MAPAGRAACSLYLPSTYSGRGVPEICMSLVPSFPRAGLDVTIFLPRARKELPDGIMRRETMVFPFRHLPWKYGERTVVWSQERAFRRAVDRADPQRTVAYFWPSYLEAPTRALLEYVRAKGIPLVREMVNTACATSGPILDAVYAKHGFPRYHNVSDSLIAHETDELPRYDWIFAPGLEVERSLIRLGIPPERILPASYGWKRGRFASNGAVERSGPIRAVFVGIVGVRKGVPELLDAWEQANVVGELVLVGDVEPLVRPRLERALATGRVRHLPFSDDVAALYRSADFFVFPSHEEGAPQVTYEAAVCGLPVITTPMGTSRLVEDDSTGIVVPAGDVDALAAAITRLAGSADLRARLGAAAQAAAEQFEYSLVGTRRGELLRRIAVREL